MPNTDWDNPMKLSGKGTGKTMQTARMEELLQLMGYELTPMGGTSGTGFTANSPRDGLKPFDLTIRVRVLKTEVETGSDGSYMRLTVQPVDSAEGWSSGRPFEVDSENIVLPSDRRHTAASRASDNNGEANDGSGPEGEKEEDHEAIVMAQEDARFRDDIPEKICGALAESPSGATTYQCKKAPNHTDRHDWAKFPIGVDHIKVTELLQGRDEDPREWKGEWLG